MRKDYYIINGKKYPAVNYYKTDVGNNYIKNDHDVFYVVREGKLVENDYFSKILIGDLNVEKITEKEFNDALQKSKDGVEGFE